MRPDIVVIGAGPAGIGAALSLGRHAVVLERGVDAAGLCGSLDLDGALFDLGGHSFHTPHPAVRELVFGALDMEEQRREAWCWLNGEWIAYPFQKHVEMLADPVLRADCMRGLAAAGAGNVPADFNGYLEHRFGRPLAELFMRPYNRKLWGPDLARMSAEWTGERVAGPPASAEGFALSGGLRKPLQKDTSIAYPARGGFAEIFRALAKRVADLRLGQAVVRVDPTRRMLTLAGGETMPWRRIVATVPLPVLLAMLPEVPQSIAALVARLEAVPVDVVMVVLEGRGPLDRQRVYCAGPEMLGHKIVLNHTSSRWLREQPRHGIEVEVASRPGMAVEQVKRDVVGGLCSLGLIKLSDVRRVELRRLELGYPVPTHDRCQIIREVRAWLGARDILLSGRFAEWAYINADEALNRGMDLGRALLLGKQPEYHVA